MNAVIEIMEKRRSIRKFESEALDEEELNAIIQAGRTAPSGGNTKMTHLFVILNETVLSNLRTLVQDEFAQMEYDENTYKSLVHSIQASQKGAYVYDYHAPALIIVANQKNYGNAMADCACILENMMIAATSLGVASCWINQLHWLDENKNIRLALEKYGLSDELTICGALALGYSDLFETLQPRKKDEGNPVVYIR